MSDSRPSSERIERILNISRFFRATSTRRTFMNRLLAVGGGVALGASAGAALTSLRAGSAFGDDEDVNLIEPKPIPGGFVTRFAGVISHHFRPARGIEASTITDFNGFIGLAEFERGTGTGMNTMTGATMPLFFGLDNRFMVGEFVGSDSEVHRGAFVEI